MWIGAATNEAKGAFSIYHGENDKRNYTEVYEKKDQLEDLEYAYVLVSIVYEAVECRVYWKGVLGCSQGCEISKIR